MELGLDGVLKQVGLTTRLCKLYVSQKSFKVASFISQLKSLKIIKFSYLLMCVSRTGTIMLRKVPLFDLV